MNLNAILLSITISLVSTFAHADTVNADDCQPAKQLCQDFRKNLDACKAAPDSAACDAFIDLLIQLSPKDQCRAAH